jgi:transcriptional regulator GlxA family with amidase domain
VESFLRRRLQPLEPGARLVQEVIDGMLATPHDTTGAQLAARHGVVRTLQRLFRRMLIDPDVDLARLALELGYADQAHFGNDFHAPTGRTPAAYLAACATA